MIQLSVRSVFVWLNRLTLLLGLISGVAYAVEEPVFTPSGDSALGLTLGVIAGLLVLKLMFLGIKKRWLIGRLGDQKTWVLAHHYTGGVLLLIALLHSGFQIDANLHGWLMLLLIFIVLTGLFGSLSYRFIPPLLNRQVEQVSEDVLLSSLKELDKNLLAETAATDVLLNQLAWQAYRGHCYARELNPLRRGYQKLLPGVGKPESFAQFARLAETRSESKFNGRTERLYHLLAHRRQLVGKLSRGRLLQGLLSKWRTLHMWASMVFFALLIVHVVISFQY